MYPWISVSPVEGLRAKLPPAITVECSPGVVVDGYKAVPLPGRFLRTPDGKSEGLLGEYFANVEFAGKPAFTRIDKGLDFDWAGAGPKEGGIGGFNYSIRWTGTFTATETKTHWLAITSDDGSFLYVDDKLVADNGGTHGEVTVPAAVAMEAGKTYRLRIDYVQGGGNAAMRLGWKDPKDQSKDPSIADAVDVARKAEVAVVCIGNSATQEGEGADVADFALYGRQQELLDQVLAANPNTIVVVFGGVPVSMKPWLSRARAVVAALYPGQEGGTALAGLLLGETNFSGKLPFSYIQDRSECPGFLGYKDAALKVPYREGLFTGYRWYDSHGISPLFPFGFGLSYTSFAYSELAVARNAQGRYEATVRVTNTGKRAGDEIVQLYVEPGQALLPRPLRELKGFGRVGLQPGEAKTVSILLDERAFSYYDPAQHAWVAEPGRYVVHAAANSRDLRVQTTVTLK